MFLYIIKISLDVLLTKTEDVLGEKKYLEILKCLCYQINSWSSSVLVDVCSMVIGQSKTLLEGHESVSSQITPAIYLTFILYFIFKY